MFKDMFPEYFRRSNEELAELWKNAIFVPDTNVLLSLYRYSAQTRDKLLDVLESVQERVWIPHQVAEEFSRRRVGVIHKQNSIMANYRDALTALGDTARKSLLKALERKHHTVIANDDVLKEFDEVIERNRKLLEAPGATHVSDDRNDHVLQRISSLFDGRIGEPFDEEVRENLVSEGAKRFKTNVPPGFCDGDKEGDDKYGDWFLWRQVLDFAKSEHRPIILITDDDKEDWWWKETGKKMGPLPELIAEMKKEASVDFHLYSSEKYLEHAKANLGSEIDDKTFDEVREMARRRNKRIRGGGKLPSNNRIFEREKREAEVIDELNRISRVLQPVQLEIDSIEAEINGVDEEISEVEQRIGELEAQSLILSAKMKRRSGTEREQFASKLRTVEMEIDDSETQLQIFQDTRRSFSDRLYSLAGIIGVDGAYELAAMLKRRSKLQSELQVIRKQTELTPSQRLF